MIINEKYDPFNVVVLEIEDPDAFINKVDSVITDSGMNESLSLYSYQVKNGLRDTLDKNAMSIPPTSSEIKKAKREIKIPAFLVGALSGELADWGLKLRKKSFDRKD